MIPSFESLDQSVITTLLERDPLVERYRAFFALLDWDAIASHLSRKHFCGPRPHPETHGMRNEVVISVESESVCREKGGKLAKKTKLCLLKRK